jgi:transcriptional regulator with XRE-family HTH domain
MVKLRNRSMAESQNVVGPRVRQLRYQQELTQDQLAAKCGVVGWDISRGTLSKIEAGLRCVTDVEIQYLAGALGVSIDDLFSGRASGKGGRTTRV